MMSEIEFLETLKDYIERSEEAMDAEWGDYRSYQKMIEDNLMPKIYNGVVKRLEKAKEGPVT